MSLVGGEKGIRPMGCWRDSGFRSERRRLGVLTSTWNSGVI
jgi:hypothetical protein